VSSWRRSRAISSSASMPGSALCPLISATPGMPETRA
jgi:hypothetical protein